MSAVATTIPPRGLGSIQLKDLFKGLYYAAVGQILALVGFLFTGLLQEHPHFPTWVEWLPYVKATLYAIGGYLTGKLGVNNVGQIFQRDRPIVHVDAVELQDLQDKVEVAETKEDEIDTKKKVKK